jgi:titin
VNWKNNANWQLTNFVVQRATNSAFTAGLVQTPSDKTDGAGVTPFGPAIGKATSFVDNFTDVATQSNKTFYYRVRAESANGYSQWSAAVGPVTSPTFVAPPTPPSAPVLGAVTSSNAGASVVVATASVLNGGTFTKYQYSLNGGTWNDFVPSATSRMASPLVVAGLTNNTTYSLTVRGVSSAGNGPASNAVTLTPSLAPTNVTVSTSLANSGTNARILVGWTGYRTNTAPGISYQVQVTNTATNAVQTVPVPGGNSTTYSVPLTNGTTTNGVAVVLARKGIYSVQVRAMLNAVPSPWVTAVPATITMG